MGNKINTKANKKPSTVTEPKIDLLAMAEETQKVSEATKKVLLDSKGKTFARKAEGTEIETLWKILPMENFPLVACENKDSFLLALSNAITKAGLSTKPRQPHGYSVWDKTNTRLWRVKLERKEEEVTIDGKKKKVSVTTSGRFKVTREALNRLDNVLDISGLELSLDNLLKFAKKKLAPVAS